jgi:uncharacterized membrane protein (DUF106 family)
MNDMLTKVLNDYYALQQESPPSPFDQAVNYLVQNVGVIVSSVITGVLITVIGQLVYDRIKSKKTKDKYHPKKRHP